MFFYNSVAGASKAGKSLAYVLGGKHSLLKQMPYMKPTNEADSKSLRVMDLAALFVPGVGEEEVLEDGLELHHLLLKEFKDIFEAADLDIEDFTITIRKSKHRLKSGPGLHTINGGRWNRVWREFLANPSNRTAPKILEQLDKMILEHFWDGAA
jgi:hypothetical protein